MSDYPPHHLHSPEQQKGESSHEEHTLRIEGMHCHSCAEGLQKAFEKEGLEGVRVDFLEEKVVFPERIVSHLPAMKAIVKRRGFRVLEEHDARSLRDRWQMPILLYALAVAAFLHGGMFFHIPLLASNLFQALIVLPVVLFAIYFFGPSAYQSLRIREPNMDVLVLTGVLASYGYSGAAWWQGLGHSGQFFETAASITGFLLLGNLLEKIAKRRTTSSLSALLEKKPEWAFRKNIQTGGHEQVSAQDLVSGDCIILREGDRIPADVIIQEGTLFVDESLVTGESQAVKKGPGDKLFAGTLLQEGSAQALVEHASGRTLLDRMFQLMQNSLQKKPKIQRAGDKVSAVFVPVVFAIAALSIPFNIFVLEVALAEAVMRAVAVLVIACPCAMGLATPTAVLVAVGRASQEGLLIKNGEVLENLSRVAVIGFDKTGTLTQHDMRVERACPSDTANQAQRYAILSAMTARSNHPISCALHAFLGLQADVSLDSMEEKKGEGLLAQMQGKTYRLGRASFACPQGIPTSYEQADLFFSEDAILHEAFYLSQPEFTPGARQLIDMLHRTGIHSALISGDKRANVQRVAETLGIKQYFSEQKPQEKLLRIQELRERGPIMFVGDGINDGPALAAADVGLAVGDAQALAAQAADVVLLRPGLGGVRDALAIGKASMRTIWQNLFWAFAYNTAAIPLAIFGLISPGWAALVMALSDVFVIGNSLRLRRQRL